MLCSSPSQLTAECTDQCVIIACSNPEHEELSCEGVNVLRCDFICDEAIECIDCHGFDAFLQCCDEYHTDTGYPTQQIDQNTTYNWDREFEAFLCACDQPDLEIKTHNTKDETSCNFHENPLQDGTNFTSPSSPLPFNCMWNSCQASFLSLSELAGHVNPHHLVNPLLSNTMEVAKDSFQPLPISDKPQAPISCLWGNCDSSYNFWPGDLDLLASHLMSEHLGLEAPYHQKPTPDPSLITCPNSELAPKVNGNAEIHADVQLDYQLNLSPLSSSPISDFTDHVCAGLHECRWDGCGKTFSSCDELTSHINLSHVGSGKAHYDCFWDQCSRSGNQGFQSKQKISRHIQSHTGHRPFQCTICQQNFSEAATLQQHIRRHTQEKPYLCDFPGCHKSFAITGALTIHKRTHNGEKPFKCTYCNRCFSESSNLSKHLRTHTGVRPYTCNEPSCGRTFARPDQLSRHKGVHTKEGPRRRTLKE